MILTTTRPLPFFPAHTGKTSSFSWLLRRSADHLRSHGENFFAGTHVGVCPGSSPLTRGKRGLIPGAAHGTRLIPAHAGKTPKKQIIHLSFPAHPRSRGENEMLDGWLEARVGSSPLTRGKRSLTGRGLPPTRLIPAHAGKTAIFAFRLDWPTAHPRSRGENLRLSSRRAGLVGSSPLTRGKRYLIVR